MTPDGACAPILRTKELTFRVGETTVVNGITVRIKEGEIVAIVGPSGAGKSTFLRLLNRLSEPTHGSVFLRGQDYAQIPPPELRRRLGLVLQQPFLFSGTVADNLRYGPAQRNQAVTAERIAYLLARVGLPDFAARDVDDLSVGEAQRISLARTLANEPEILLLDEPTSALDPVAERDVEELILEIIHDQRLTCLIVTHDEAQARRMAGRTLTLRVGRLVGDNGMQEPHDAV